MKKCHVDNKDMKRLLCVLSGVFINVLLSFLLFKFKIPLFLDTIGTVFVTMLGGSFLGIAVGVLTPVPQTALWDNLQGMPLRR